MKKKQRIEFETRGLLEVIGAYPAKAYSLLAEGPGAIDATSASSDDAGLSRFAELWRDARALAERETFLHWEVAFPGVWRHWQRRSPEGGFDAVIGNPPWDRIKLQEVEWFATRDPELARARTAALRRKGIKKLRDRSEPVAAAFDEAMRRADGLLTMFRKSDHYQQLGRGDINWACLDPRQHRRECRRNLERLQERLYPGVRGRYVGER